MFSGVQFCVLGLGDTNYDKFCHMGKSINKRMGELGGERILDLHCADEATGLEETIEAWKLKVIETIVKLVKSFQLNNTSTTGLISTKRDELDTKNDIVDVKVPSEVNATLESDVAVKTSATEIIDTTVVN
jgi:sulfite reductase alpha subunit-like flavoprotein